MDLDRHGRKQQLEYRACESYNYKLVILVSSLDLYYY